MAVILKLKSKNNSAAMPKTIGKGSLKIRVGIFFILLCALLPWADEFLSALIGILTPVVESEIWSSVTEFWVLFLFVNCVILLIWFSSGATLDGWGYKCTDAEEIFDGKFEFRSIPVSPASVSKISPVSCFPLFSEESFFINSNEETGIGNQAVGPIIDEITGSNCCDEVEYRNPCPETVLDEFKDPHLYPETVLDEIKDSDLCAECTCSIDDSKSDFGGNAKDSKSDFGGNAKEKKEEKEMAKEDEENQGKNKILQNKAKRKFKQVIRRNSTIPTSQNRGISVAGPAGLVIRDDLIAESSKDELNDRIEAFLAKFQEQLRLQSLQDRRN